MPPEGDLSKANLAEAKITTEQLDHAKSLEGTTMRDGSIRAWWLCSVARMLRSAALDGLDL